MNESTNCGWWYFRTFAGPWLPGKRRSTACPPATRAFLLFDKASLVIGTLDLGMHGLFENGQGNNAQGKKKKVNQFSFSFVP